MLATVITALPLGMKEILQVVTSTTNADTFILARHGRDGQKTHVRALKGDEY
jgi:hypothetical protein